MEVDLVFHKEKKHERFSAFNVRNKLCQQKFHEYTTNTNMFTNCFVSTKQLVHQFKTWKSKFQKSLFACFRKVRMTEADPKPTKIDDIIFQKKTLKEAKHNSLDVDDKLEEIKNKITRECANKEFDKLKMVDLETES